MKYTLNGSTINLSKDIITEEFLNTIIKEIDSSYKSCSKAIEAYNLVSNVKAMESFGYKATEGLGESIKNGAKAIWVKIKTFFQNMSEFFKTQYIKILAGDKNSLMQECRSIANFMYLIMTILHRRINHHDDPFMREFDSDEEIKLAKDCMKTVISIRNTLIPVTIAIKNVYKKIKNKEIESVECSKFLDIANLVLKDMRKNVGNAYSATNNAMDNHLFKAAFESLSVYLNVGTTKKNLKNFVTEGEKIIKQKIGIYID